jgi:hypothetical protein
MQYPVVPDPVYTTIASYMEGSISIAWQGTWQNGTIKETSYVYGSTAQLSTQEQVRNNVITYIKNNHEETAQFMQSFNWTGGRVEPETPMVGSETYTYLSQGWNVTIQYPVVPNPIYTIIADYSASASGTVSIPYRVIWQGTWENGVITETSYTFAQ